MMYLLGVDAPDGDAGRTAPYIHISYGGPTPPWRSN